MCNLSNLDKINILFKGSYYKKCIKNLMLKYIIMHKNDILTMIIKTVLKAILWE